ncbi:MAG TPA: hypothetical protein VLR88_09790 [Propionibacteriaceae bacterium]|nr:hypothetical protein [Propionibacteriaceae bacterium]
MTASLSRGRRVARAAAALVAAGTLGLSGCANYATLDSYTPAAGVNVDAPTVKIRNLLIIADASGAGKLSGALVGSESDTLTALAGIPIKLDNAEGEALTFSKVSVPIVAGRLTKLDEAGITVSGADLQPGLNADLVLTFTKIGDVTVTVPVVSSDHPDFSSEG